jgi:ssDNA-binding Zn-finger/Zn-ribbon topoisomerase 1
MPVKTMICPKCGHKYNLPSREAKYGFKRCPKCGIRKKQAKIKKDQLAHIIMSPKKYSKKYEL